MPWSLALIAHAYPQARGAAERSACGAARRGSAWRPARCSNGVLVAALGWRAIFLVNVPIAAAAALLLVRHVEETHRHGHPLDIAGQLLAIAGLASLTAGSSPRAATAGERRSRCWSPGSRSSARSWSSNERSPTRR